MASVEKLVATCDLCGKTASNPENWSTVRFEVCSLNAAAPLSFLSALIGVRGSIDACDGCMKDAGARPSPTAIAIRGLFEVMRRFLKRFGLRRLG